MSTAPSPAAPNAQPPSPSQAQCAQHPERSARSACGRCGTFVCQECFGQGGLCPACRARTDVDNPYVSCPECGARSAKLQSFTWWGGALGPRLFTHVKCGGCSATYNGKTGRSNTTAITVYLVVSSLIAIGFLYAIH